MNTNVHDLRERLYRIVEVQRRVHRLLEASDPDPQLLKDYRALVSYLQKIDEKTLRSIFEKPKKKVVHSLADGLRFSDEFIRKTSTAELFTLLEHPDLDRQTLERVAILRFSVPKGSLSVLRSKQALLDKLENLLTNEATHEGIARVVAASPNNGNEGRGEPLNREKKNR